MKPFFERIKGSTIAKTMLIVIALVGGIAGLVMGGSADSDVSFFAALSVWLPTALVTVALLLCYCHFRNQEKISESLDVIARSVKKGADTEKEIAEDGEAYEYEYLED